MLSYLVLLLQLFAFDLARKIEGERVREEEGESEREEEGKRKNKREREGESEGRKDCWKTLENLIKINLPMPQL